MDLTKASVLGALHLTGPSRRRQILLEKVKADGLTETKAALMQIVHGESRADKIAALEVGLS